MAAPALVARLPEWTRASIAQPALHKPLHRYAGEAEWKPGSGLSGLVLPVPAAAHARVRPAARVPAPSAAAARPRPVAMPLRMEPLCGCSTGNVNRKWASAPGFPSIAITLVPSLLRVTASMRSSFSCVNAPCMRDCGRLTIPATRLAAISCCCWMGKRPPDNWADAAMPCSACAYMEWAGWAWSDSSVMAAGCTDVEGSAAGASGCDWDCGASDWVWICTRGAGPMLNSPKLPFFARS